MLATYNPRIRKGSVPELLSAVLPLVVRINQLGIINKDIQSNTASLSGEPRYVVRADKEALLAAAGVVEEVEEVEEPVAPQEEFEAVDFLAEAEAFVEEDLFRELSRDYSAGEELEIPWAI